MAEEQNSKNWVKERLGQKVQVVFLDANVMKGVLKKVTRYELVLEVSENKEEVVVFKHAVKYIR
ncbi:hypothetical protein [Enterococcus sp. DIV1420a]|uniref:hypothetical protein n=1 Tax=Enterococcus sp. DIV1420a TaxID=2774672 RepID=UPI0036D6EA85